MKIKLSLSDLSNTTDNFSYLLAYKLLQQSSKYGPVSYLEVSQLITLCLIGCDVYSVVESEEFLKTKAEFDRSVNFC